MGKNTGDFGGIRFSTGDAVVIKWAFSGLNQTGGYFASVGVSTASSLESFIFRQYKMRTFSIVKQPLS